MAAVVLDVAVLHRWRIIPALDLDEAGLRDRFSIIALADIAVLQDIARKLLVDERRVRLHRLLHVQHERKLLILDLQRAHALHRRYLVLCDDNGDIVSVVAHMAVEQVPVRQILMFRIHRPGMPRRWKAVLRHIEARQHLYNARDRLGCRNIHAFDESVRDGGMLDARIQRAGGHPVLVIPDASRYLVERIYADLAFPYLVHPSSSSLKRRFQRFRSKDFVFSL